MEWQSIQENDCHWRILLCTVIFREPCRFTVDSTLNLQLIDSAKNVHLPKPDRFVVILISEGNQKELIPQRQKSGKKKNRNTQTGYVANSVSSQCFVGIKSVRPLHLQGMTAKWQAGTASKACQPAPILCVCVFQTCKSVLCNLILIYL